MPPAGQPRGLAGILGGGKSKEQSFQTFDDNTVVSSDVIGIPYQQGYSGGENGKGSSAGPANTEPEKPVPQEASTKSKLSFPRRMLPFGKKDAGNASTPAAANNDEPPADSPQKESAPSTTVPSSDVKDHDSTHNSSRRGRLTSEDEEGNEAGEHERTSNQHSVKVEEKSREESNHYGPSHRSRRRASMSGALSGHENHEPTVTSSAADFQRGSENRQRRRASLSATADPTSAGPVAIDRHIYDEAPKNIDACRNRARRRASLSAVPASHNIGGDDEFDPRPAIYEPRQSTPAQEKTSTGELDYGYEMEDRRVPSRPAAGGRRRASLSNAPVGEAHNVAPDGPTDLVDRSRPRRRASLNVSAVSGSGHTEDFSSRLKNRSSTDNGDDKGVSRRTVPRTLSSAPRLAELAGIEIPERKVDSESDRRTPVASTPNTDPMKVIDAVLDANRRSRGDESMGGRRQRRASLASTGVSYREGSSVSVSGFSDERTVTLEDNGTRRSSRQSSDDSSSTSRRRSGAPSTTRNGVYNEAGLQIPVGAKAYGGGEDSESHRSRPRSSVSGDTEGQVAPVDDQRNGPRRRASLSTSGAHTTLDEAHGSSHGESSKQRQRPSLSGAPPPPQPSSNIGKSPSMSRKTRLSTSLPSNSSAEAEEVKTPSIPRPRRPSISTSTPSAEAEQKNTLPRSRRPSLSSPAPESNADARVPTNGSTPKIPRARRPSLSSSPTPDPDSEVAKTPVPRARRPSLTSSSPSDSDGAGARARRPSLSSSQPSESPRPPTCETPRSKPGESAKPSRQRRPSLSNSPAPEKENGERSNGFLQKIPRPRWPSLSSSPSPTPPPAEGDVTKVPRQRRPSLGGGGSRHDHPAPPELSAEGKTHRVRRPSLKSSTDENGLTQLVFDDTRVTTG